MKKSIIIPSLLGVSVLLTGCNTQNNIELPDANVDLQKSEVCNDNKGFLTNRAEGGDITVCAFDDDSFCFLEDLESGECKKGLIFFNDNEEIEINEETNNIEAGNNNEVNEPENIECDQTEQDIVCGKDGNTYQNKCYLNKAGVEEEVELAHVENGECIFE